MMVVDSSASCAIFFNEVEKAAFQAAIDGDDQCLQSAVNAHETASLLRGRLGREAVAAFWLWLGDNGIKVAAFDESQAQAAASALYRHGKGINSKASLNLADCAAYALA